MKQRPSARILVLSAKHNVLLFNFSFHDGPLAGQNFWATPGGGLENDETYRQAAQRELFEETGVAIDVGFEIAQRDSIFKLPSGETIFADERYFVVHCPNVQIDQSNHSDLEKRCIHQHKWWSVADLLTTEETVYPENLISMLLGLMNSEGISRSDSTARPNQ